MNLVKVALTVFVINCALFRIFILSILKLNLLNKIIILDILTSASFRLKRPFNLFLSIFKLKLSLINFIWSLFIVNFGFFRLIVIFFFIIS